MIFKPLLHLIAPHSCLSCGRVSRIICVECLPGLGTPKTSACVFCNRLTTDFRVCDNCRRDYKLTHVNVAARHEDHVQRLIHLLKYKGVVEAAKPLGALMVWQLSRRPDMIVPIPSAARRYRQRGFNPAKLLALEVAKAHKIPLLEALGRRGKQRQVGASRSKRLTQLKGSFHVRHQGRVKGANILLIDDVVTTGATLREAATVLRTAGARNVRALVVAKN